MNSECRCQLRMDSAFFRTQSRSQNLFNLDNTHQKSNRQTLFFYSEKQNNWQTLIGQKFAWHRTRSNFWFSAVARVSVVFVNVIVTVKYFWISIASMVAGVCTIVGFSYLKKNSDPDPDSKILERESSSRNMKMLLRREIHSALCHTCFLKAVGLCCYDQWSITITPLQMKFAFCTAGGYHGYWYIDIPGTFFVTHHRTRHRSAVLKHLSALLQLWAVSYVWQSLWQCIWCIVIVDFGLIMIWYSYFIADSWDGPYYNYRRKSTKSG